MLISKDYHALWLNSAALALAGGDLEVEAESSSATGPASRPAFSTRRLRGSSRRASSKRPTTSTSPRCARA
jgi:hypothetical protein